MMESVPAFAPTSPPETGASMAIQPAFAALLAMATAREGVDVVISTRRPPGLRLASTPSGPNVTDSTSSGVPTMVNTTSASFAAALGDGASTAPLATRSAHLAAVRLKTAALCPPFMRCPHMCLPITPTPIHATFIEACFRGRCTYGERDRPRSAFCRRLGAHTTPTVNDERNCKFTPGADPRRGLAS